MAERVPEHDHEISLQPGIVLPNRLADALADAKAGHTTRVGYGNEDYAYVVPAGRYRKLCELEQVIGGDVEAAKGYANKILEAASSAVLHGTTSVVDLPPGRIVIGNILEGMGDD